VNTSSTPLSALCFPLRSVFFFYTENKRGYTELHGELFVNTSSFPLSALCFPVCSVLFLLHGEQKRLHGVTRRIICEHLLHSPVFPCAPCVILFNSLYVYNILKIRCEKVNSTSIFHFY